MHTQHTYFIAELLIPFLLHIQYAIKVIVPQPSRYFFSPHYILLLLKTYNKPFFIYELESINVNWVSFKENLTKLAVKLS